MAVAADSELVLRLRAGDERAFDDVYERFHVQLYGFLLRASARHDLADDLAQETWIRFATNARSLRADTRLGAWLFTVARNLLRSHHRWRELDRWSLERCGPRGTGDEGSPLALAAAAEVERKIEEAIAHLPRRYREVVALVAGNGLGQEDTARVLGVRPDALRQRLSRARAMLRSELAGLDILGEDQGG